LKEEVEKGAKASDTEYVVYQSKVTQGADNITSIKLRTSILKRKLIEYDTSFSGMFDINESEEELSKLKRKDTIKELSDTCILSISNINKIYKSKNGEDLFKTTNEVLTGSLTISNPVDSEDEFKKIIDALYKIIYEGSGTLKRIPNELLPDDSIYFDIKHLRTDFFHDIEHGDKKKILKKENIIKGIYEKYLGKSSFHELEVGELVHLQRKSFKEYW